MTSPLKEEGKVVGMIAAVLFMI